MCNSRWYLLLREREGAEIVGSNVQLMMVWAFNLEIY